MPSNRADPPLSAAEAASVSRVQKPIKNPANSGIGVLMWLSPFHPGDSCQHWGVLFGQKGEVGFKEMSGETVTRVSRCDGKAENSGASISRGVRFTMEKNEASDPIDMGSCGSKGVVVEVKNFAALLETLELGIGDELFVPFGIG